jgi:tRNA A-37 threonylcarbamoyl transferase component Bud32/DNA-binding transcriptional ArsR family regulator
MSSTARLNDTNKLITDKRRLLIALNDPKCFLVLHLLHKRGALSLSEVADELSLDLGAIDSSIRILQENGLLARSENHLGLTSLATKKLGYMSYPLDSLVGSTLIADSSTVNNPLHHDYEIKELVGRGATSVTFRATQSGTHRDRILKVFQPSTIIFEQLDSAIRKRAKIENKAIPDVVDAGEVRIQVSESDWVITSCVALVYVNGNAKSFADFLASQENITSEILKRFIERVGGALSAIEAAGLIHGDLHEGNILVTPGSTPGMACDFWVIDFVGVPSSTSPDLTSPTDLSNFRDHLLRAVIIACSRHPGYSARLLLGERVFRVLENLRAEKYKSFAEMLKDFYMPLSPIPDGYFRTPDPQPFEWLRVEWFPSSRELYMLFEPEPSRYETIKRFGNAWISGPRGCGKSHYLRVLAFHPSAIAMSEENEELNYKLEQMGYDYKRDFGVLFTCRLGEFKGFAPEAMEKAQFDVMTQAFLKHILVLKIWNKTLNTIKEGFETLFSKTGQPVLELPRDFIGLIKFLEERLGTMTVVDDPNPMNLFLQCLSTVTANEISAVAIWHTPSRRPGIRLLDERDLDEFFATVKNAIPTLNQVRFFILVDDASYGHIHLEMQKVLNSLVRAVHAHHCFKITCDRFMYTLDTADGRSIDPRHEVTYIDLGEVSIKSQRETAVDLSEHMARVINLRLNIDNFREDIRKILGVSQDVRTFLSALSQPGARRPKKGETLISRRPLRQKAYYAGWNIVWSISHGSVRTLLELVEYIFKANNVTRETINIPLKNQDAAVRMYSNRHYKALSMLPGEFEGKPLGQILQNVLSAIGEMSRQYLERYDTGEEYRWYETISLERNDNTALSSKAQHILNELVKEGLLLEEGVTFTRAQIGLSRRYDMNKIFAPAFQTTYRVRNHIFLGHNRLEEFLLKPDAFVSRHRRKLDELAESPDGRGQKPLFG